MKSIALLTLILFSSLCAAAPAATKVSPIAITTQVDKTAIWVGDELLYTIRAIHDQNIELVLDNFKKELLPLAPFVVQSIEIRQRDYTGNKKLAEMALLLRAFETGKSELTIPALPLYYFIHEPGLSKKESPVTTVMAPAVTVGLRSVLVPNRLAPREMKSTASPRPEWAWAAIALGLAGILWLLGRALRWAWQKLHRHETVKRLTRRGRKRIAKRSLTRLRADTKAAGDDARRWSGAIAGVLREFVEQMLQTPAVGLTAQEAEAALVQSGIDAPLSAEFKAALTQCDELRYGKEPVAEEGLRERILQTAERLIRSPHMLAV